MRQVIIQEEAYQAQRVHSVHSVHAAPASRLVQVVLAAEPAEALQVVRVHPVLQLPDHHRHLPVRVSDAAAVRAVHRLLPAPAAEALADHQAADINICDQILSSIKRNPNFKT
jgi:hypothetical protein